MKYFYDNKMWKCGLSQKKLFIFDFQINFNILLSAKF